MAMLKFDAPNTLPVEEAKQRVMAPSAPWTPPGPTVTA